MNKHINNDASGREEEEKKNREQAEPQKTAHQGQPGSARPEDWNPGKSAGNKEEEGGVRPE